MSDESARNSVLEAIRRQYGVSLEPDEIEVTQR